jgi:hypothetical protein
MGDSMLTFIGVQAAEPWSGLLSRLDELARGAGQSALYVAVAAVVMLLGWALAALLSWLVRVALRLLRFDSGVRRVLGQRATVRRDPIGVISWTVYWAVMAGAVLLALETLGFSLGESVAERLSDVVPRIVTAALLFAIGSLLAGVVGGITRRFLNSAGVRSAKLQGQVVTTVLTGFAALLALEQLGFAAQFIMALGIVAVATAGLGLALAFGLGCRDLARDFLVEYLRSLEDEGPKRPL